MTKSSQTRKAAKYSPPGAGVAAAIRRFKTLVKVATEDTGGHYSVLEHALEPETLAMPLHRHRTEVKTFYAVEGALTVQLGTDVFIATPGSSIVIPAGTMHTMWNETERRVRFLSVVAPGGLERYYAEVAAVVPSQGKPDIDAVIATSARYGIELDMLSLYDIIERHHVQLA
jgi:mannose-6-phosphate isomerase-like protein (cupin superfamily)